MQKGNVLVIGNSGVGKSTLINSVLGENRAKEGWGTKGTTEYLEVYEGNGIPFRIIDTVGFEPSFLKERKAIDAVKKWSKQRAKDEEPDNDINVIWFCVDGTARKLFSKSIESLTKATSMWKTVPIIVVITKSYSEPERDDNIQMVHKAFEKQKREKNLIGVIPVVAKTFTLNESAYAPPEGITELIDLTNEVMPAGIKAAKNDVAQFKLNRKRALAHSVVGVATTAGVVVGAMPIPLADAAILSPIEAAEVKSMAKLYGVSKKDNSSKLIETIVEVGTVSAVAKAAISAIKAIPGLNVAASVLNAVIAGSFVAALGEGSIYVFEQVYLGNKTVDDIDWVKKIVESRFSTELVNKVGSVFSSLGDDNDKDKIIKTILDLVTDTLRIEAK